MSEPDPIDAYVLSLAGRLGVVWPQRSDRFLQEVHDHLTDATASWQSTGLLLAEAQRAAVAEFGDEGDIANAVRSQAGNRLAQYSVLLMVGMTPLITAFWEIWMDVTDPASASHPVVSILRLLALSTLLAGVGVVVTTRIRWTRLPTVVSARTSAAVMLVGAIGCIGLALTLLGRHVTLAASAVTLATTVLPFSTIVALATRSLMLTVRIPPDSSR